MFVAPSEACGISLSSEPTISAEVWVCVCVALGLTGILLDFLQGDGSPLIQVLPVHLRGYQLAVGDAPLCTCKFAWTYWVTEGNRRTVCVGSFPSVTLPTLPYSTLLGRFACLAPSYKQEASLSFSSCKLVMLASNLVPRPLTNSC